MLADDDLTTDHPVVSHEEWLAARRTLLEKEKAFTRQCDEMSRLERSLPWERVTKARAAFAKLADFQKRMQWRFKWVSSGGSDFNFDYQASFTAEEMAAKRAMYNCTIRDPLAREREGHSIFYKDPSGTVFHTYSCYDRGNDKLNLHYHYLDVVPKGRDEAGRGPYWVRRHDEYDR
jgi:predicted dithiol-disulfide oxidoreductase (DUF899 family)